MNELANQDRATAPTWRTILKEEAPYIALGIFLFMAVITFLIKVTDHYFNLWMWNFIQELSQSGMLDQTSLEWEVMPPEGVVVA